MENIPYSKSPAIHGYGKHSIFKFPSQTMLWKTQHILVPQPYNAMENNTYSSSHAILDNGKHTNSSSPAIKGY
jgi:hypothetical protein